MLIRLLVQGEKCYRKKTRKKKIVNAIVCNDIVVPIHDNLNMRKTVLVSGYSSTICVFTLTLDKDTDRELEDGETKLFSEVQRIQVLYKYF